MKRIRATSFLALAVILSGTLWEMYYLCWMATAHSRQWMAKLLTYRGGWDLIVAFPPCTYLSNAGACRLYPKKGQLDKERYQKGLEAKDFFMKFLEADCPRIAVENPVSSKVFDMPLHTQEIQPYEFDPDGEHQWTKKTRLWLVGLDPLMPTTPFDEPVGPYVPSDTGRKDRSKYGAAKRGEDAKNRAKTFHGIARAMAAQFAGDNWGGGTFPC